MQVGMGYMNAGIDNYLTTRVYIEVIQELKLMCEDLNLDESTISKFPKFEDPIQIKDFEKWTPKPSMTAVTQIIMNEVPNSWLLIYETAQILKLKEFSKHVVRIWRERFEKFVENKVEGVADIDVVAAKISEVIKEVKWPNFSNPTASQHELIDALTYPIAIEILRIKFYGDATPEFAPPHVVPLLGLKNITVSEAFLIDKYSPLMTMIQFHNEENIDDKTVLRALRRFQNVSVLNLTNCVKLTPRCFRYGHKKVQTIILNGTTLQKKDIPSQIFPSLTTIEQKSIFYRDLDMISKEESWPEILTRFTPDVTILIGDSGVEILLEKFLDNPTIEGVETLQFIRRKYPIPGFNESLAKAFIQSWRKNKEGQWDNEQSFQPYMTKVLIKELMIEDFDGGIDVIINAFSEDISGNFLFRNNEDGSFRAAIDDLSHPTYCRIRFLLRLLNAYNLMENKLESVFHLVEDNIIRINYIDFKDKREERIYGIYLSFLLEVLVEISHQTIISDTDIFERLHNIFITSTSRPRALSHESVVVDRHIFLPAPQKSNLEKISQQSMDYIVTCFFTIRISRPNRERKLGIFLSNLVGYQVSEGFKLSTLILGNPQALPNLSQSSLLIERLGKYRGVFFEDIAKRLKENFWEFLCEGKLDGVSETLVDDLCIFFNKVKEPWTGRVQTALGVIVKKGTTSVVKKHAKEKLKEILPKVKLSKS